LNFATSSKDHPISSESGQPNGRLNEHQLPRKEGNEGTSPGVLTPTPSSSAEHISSDLINKTDVLIVFLSTPHTGYLVWKATTKGEAEYKQLKS
jgi:hypothetical protein